MSSRSARRARRSTASCASRRGRSYTKWTWSSTCADLLVDSHRLCAGQFGSLPHEDGRPLHDGASVDAVHGGRGRAIDGGRRAGAGRERLAPWLQSTHGRVRLHHVRWSRALTRTDSLGTAKCAPATLFVADISGLQVRRGNTGARHRLRVVRRPDHGAHRPVSPRRPRVRGPSHLPAHAPVTASQRRHCTFVRLLCAWSVVSLRWCRCCWRFHRGLEPGCPARAARAGYMDTSARPGCSTEPARWLIEARSD